MYFKQWHFSIGIFKLGANFVNYLHVLASFRIYWQLFGTNFGACEETSIDAGGNMRRGEEC